MNIQIVDRGPGDRGIYFIDTSRPWNSTGIERKILTYIIYT